MALTQVKPLGLDKPVDLAENEKIRLGTDNHLQIYHNTHSYIAHSGSGTEELLLAGNIISLNNAAASAYMIKATENGSVNLFYNGNTRFETTNDGATVAGKLVINQGAVSSEFNGTGATTVKINGGGTGNGYCQLLMTSAGTASTNYITSDATIDFFVGGSILKVASDYSVSLPSSSSKLKIGSDGNLQISRDTGGNHIKNLDTNGQYLNIWTDDFWVGKRDGTENYIVATHDDGVDLFFDGTKRFETTADGALVTGLLKVGTSTAGFDTYGDDLTIGTSGHTGITVRSGTTHRGSIYFSDGTSGDAEYQGYVQYNHDDNRLVFGTAATERIRIDSAGYVGIGETTPDALLVIKGNSDSVNIPSIRLKDGSDTREAWITNASGDLMLSNGGDDNVPHCNITLMDANLITMATANVEKVRIDSAGRMMIQNQAIGHSGWADTLTIGSNSGNHGLTIRSATNGYGNVYFSDATSGNGTDSYKGMITYRHTDETMEIAANHGGSYVRLNSNGLMINSTSAANALNDYEDGTWTPAFTTADGDFSSISYSSQDGHYIKVGRVVHCWMRINVSSISGGSSSGLRINGLPFPAATGDGIDGGTLNVNYYTQFSGMGDMVPSGYIANGASHIVMGKKGGNNWSGLASNGISTTNFYAEISYHTAS